MAKYQNHVHTLQRNPGVTSEWIGCSSHPLLSLFTRAKEQEAMVVASLSLEQKGRVRFHGSLWLARCTQPQLLQPGDRVKVVGFSNITLWVEPLN